MCSTFTRPVWRVWTHLCFSHIPALQDFHFFNYYLLYNIVLVLPYINMHPPRVYMCPPFPFLYKIEMGQDFRIYSQHPGVPASRSRASSRLLGRRGPRAPSHSPPARFLSVGTVSARLYLKIGAHGSRGRASHISSKPAWSSSQLDWPRGPCHHRWGSSAPPLPCRRTAGRPPPQTGGLSSSGQNVSFPEMLMVGKWMEP